MSSRSSNLALILNVDDDAAARYTKTRFLQYAGYGVIEADSGAEALRQIQGAKPDLVVLDVRLPDMSGLDVCARIKKDRELAGTLVLQTSASFVESQDRVAALDIGADMYLVEPMETKEFIAVVRALLRLRAAEREANQSHRRFDVLARSAPVGIFHADVHGACTFVNATWRRITGLAPDQSLGIGWRDVLHPDDRERVVAAFAQAASGGHDFQAEYRFRKPNGEVAWVWGQALPELDETERVVGYIGSITDITERKQAEEKLREADRSKDEFLAMLSHELRNPLAPLRTMLEILRRRAGDLGMASELEVMDRQVRQLTRLTDDLFDVVRFTQKRVPLHKERTELRRIVAAAVETSRPLLEEAGHTLESNQCDEAIPLDGDPVRLAQVVSNLLNNAAKFTPPGGRIALSVRREGDCGIVVVEDNGRGMPAQALPHIFELGAQFGGREDQPQGGLGIGLTLSKRIVDLHGGSLGAHSAGIGSGSRFTISLPLQDRETVPERDAPEKPNIESMRPMRVLVVDDNADASATLALLLEMEGNEVRTAVDGISALGIAQSFMPELILLDIGLPDITGHEVVRRMRKEAWAQNVVFVAVTGWGQEADRRRSREAGFHHHLVKPIALQDLAALLTSRGGEMEGLRTPRPNP